MNGIDSCVETISLVLLSKKPNSPTWTATILCSNDGTWQSMSTNKIGTGSVIKSYDLKLGFKLSILENN